MALKIVSEDDEFVIEVSVSAFVLTLKHLIRNYSRIPVARQDLIFGGAILNDFKSLKDYGIGAGDEIKLSVRPAIKRRNEAACENCGELGHPRKECLERPRMILAKFQSASKMLTEEEDKKESSSKKKSEGTKKKENESSSKKSEGAKKKKKKLHKNKAK